MLILLIQFGVIIYFLRSGSLVSKISAPLMQLVSVAVTLYIISLRTKGAFKLTWVMLILLFPVFGGLLYLIFNFQTTYKMSARLAGYAENKTKPYLQMPETGLENTKAELPEYSPLINYLFNFCGYPVYDGTETKYLSPGEKMLEEVLSELEKAKEYIFLEFFIIEEGKMWNSILEVLKRKAAEGVKVRILYDDMGCFLTLPKNYNKTLNSFGIDCVVFNPFRPVLVTVQNNRDHRKIISIDGKVAFTGGINLADEYINEYEKHGHWKDCSVKLSGKSAWSLTLIFLQMWRICKKNDEELGQFYPFRDALPSADDGFSQPYADSPLDLENVSEHIYLKIINNAKKYVYINTPYLIIDDSMVSALNLAAKSGVDVRIVTPKKWDKWLIHMTTRSYYKDLIASGVRIYEYEKGFMHSKTFVSDDNLGVIGTANLDFRSLYLHFECGVVMYKTKALYELKEDFLNTLNSCEEITLNKCKANFFMKIIRVILRLFAPLM